MEKKIDIHVRMIQHADDSTFPMTNEKSPKKALELNNYYNVVAVMVSNMSKTESILTRRLKNRSGKIHNAYLDYTCAKTLGVYIGHDKEMYLRNNWTKNTGDVENLIES
jgi:hypothetical protein